MYLHEPTFDIEELFQSNYHIHTSFSRCGKTEMRLKSIIEEARNAGLNEIAITDHIHPGEGLKMKRIIPILRRKLKKISPDIKVYIGAELSAYGINKHTVLREDTPLDYRLYSHNHYHMFGWEQPKDHSPEGYKEHCKKTMRNIILSGDADCLAHPFCDHYIVREFEDIYGFTRNCITSLWTDNEIGDILTLGKEHYVAWELNVEMLRKYPDFAKKYFALGRETGVCFNAGSDAHTLVNVNTKQYIDEMKTLLGVN